MSVVPFGLDVYQYNNGIAIKTITELWLNCIKGCNVQYFSVDLRDFHTCRVTTICMFSIFSQFFLTLTQMTKFSSNLDRRKIDFFSLPVSKVICETKMVLLIFTISTLIGHQNSPSVRDFIKRQSTGIFPFYWGNFPLLLLINLRRFYRNNPKYWDRETFANSVDPDQTPHSVASDQLLHCLPYIYSNILDTLRGRRMNFFKI